MTPARLGALVFAALAVLYGATLQTQAFSDSIHLASMVSGGDVYYNVLYVPLGRALHLTLGGALGWPTDRTLALFSALAGAAAGALVAGALRARGASTPNALSWTALFALAPGTWFFSTVVEVHALQLAGDVGAVLLALAARRAPARRALALVGAAAALAVLCHLTGVLLVPALIGLALRDEEGRGLELRPAPLLGVCAALLLLVLGVMQLGRAQTMLSVFARLWPQRFDPEKGLAFSGAEMADYLGDEVARPLLFLLLAPLLALFAWRARAVRHLFTWTLVAALPFLVIFPQGGIRERGAYFLSVAGLLALLGGEATRVLEERKPALRALLPVFLALLAVRAGVVAHAEIEAHDVGVLPREWARRVAEITGPDAFVLTSTLPRWHALMTLETHPTCVDLRRELELVPAAKRDDRALATLARAPGAVERESFYLDADLIRGGDAETVELLGSFRERMSELPVRLDPLPVDEPLVFRLVPLRGPRGSERDG